MGKDNIFYKDGYRLGVKFGKISKLEKIVLSDSFEEFDAEYIQKEIIQSCIDLEEKFPMKFLDDGYEVSRKDIDFYLLGYTEGKQKYSRNKADKKYHEKIGLKSKSYKLHEDVIDGFAKACEKNGTSLASTLEKLMTGFIDEVENKNE